MAPHKVATTRRSTQRDTELRFTCYAASAGDKEGQHEIVYVLCVPDAYQIPECMSAA